MKFHIQILIFLFPIIIYSQKALEGKYHIPDLSGSTYEFLNFDKDGNFEYAKGGDLGEPQPIKGNYEFKNQLLILNFNNTQSKKLGFDKKEIWRNKNEFVEVKIKVMDFDKNLIKHANVFIDENLRKKTNKEGVVEFKFKKGSFTKDFRITWIGFEYYELEIDLNYNYQIEVYLAPDLQEIPIRNQIDTIKIQEFKKNFFKTEKNIIWRKSEQEY